MPKFDMLNELETATATTEGWGLFHVFDLESDKWRVMALATNGATQVDAGQFVINRARMGAAHCIKALQEIMKSNQ